jgi:hypothetical protein
MLDMSACKRCILGQLYGDILDGVTKLNIDYKDDATLGFDVQPRANNSDRDALEKEDYHELLLAWIEEINRRKQQHANRLRIPPPSLRSRLQISSRC